VFLLAVAFVSSVAVSSAAAGPVVFDPSPVTFGGQGVGTTSSPITVTLSNSGDSDVNVSGNGVSTTDPAFAIQSDNCSGATLNPAGGANPSCTVSVTFTPGQAQGYSAQLQVTSDAPTSPDLVSLTGTGTAAPAPALSAPASVDAGDQKVGTSSSNTTVHVQNTGNADLNVGTPSVSNTVSGSGFDIASNGCGAAVAPGNGCTITISFAPTSAGSKGAVLTIPSDDPASPAAVTLTGNGTMPQASVNGPISFATPRGVAQTQGVTLTNTGDAVLDVQGLRLIGGDSFTAIHTGDCGNAVLQPGGSCTAQVQYLPTTTGAETATLRFTDDSGSVAGSTQDVLLQGTVLVPGIQANPSTASFGHLVVGRISDGLKVTVKNTGQAKLTITRVNIGGVNYKSFVLRKNTCMGTGVAPGASCTVHVRFAPRKTGGKIGALVLESDARPKLQVPLSGSGNAPADATRLHTATSCGDVRLTWHVPDAAGFSRMVLVRNSHHTPRNAGDGAIVDHRASSALDKRPRQFHSYHYALFAAYRSYDRSRTYMSPGIDARVHLGRVCKPRDGGAISDLTPEADWTGYRGATSYAFILQHNGDTVLVHYTHRTSYQFRRSWVYHGTHSFQRGRSYILYLYAYTRTRPNGRLIGHSAFSER
jgi:ASPM-SPD-2-Hydin domain-containing protein/centrosomal CEP192-like protein